MTSRLEDRARASPRPPSARRRDAALQGCGRWDQGARGARHPHGRRWHLPRSICSGRDHLACPVGRQRHVGDIGDGGQPPPPPANEIGHQHIVGQVLGLVQNPPAARTATPPMEGTPGSHRVRSSRWHAAARGGGSRSARRPGSRQPCGPAPRRDPRMSRDSHRPAHA